MADVAIQAKAQDINFVTNFTTDLRNLMNILGKEDVQVVAPGTAHKIYKASGTLPTDAVAEKAEIPDANYTVGDPTLVEIKYDKFRNMTSIEKIGALGYETAVSASNNAMLKDIQKKIRSTIFTSIATGTGTATGATFQAKVANAAAYLEKKFEDEAHTPIIFANPDDAYGYLADHNVTLETSFGLSYLSNFLGIANVVIDSNVPAGTVYGTATENLVIDAASISAIPGMDLTTDESGIIAVHNGARYENAALDLVAYCGLAVLPVFADRIVKVTTAA